MIIIVFIQVASNLTSLSNLVKPSNIIRQPTRMLSNQSLVFLFHVFFPSAVRMPFRTTSVAGMALVIDNVHIRLVELLTVIRF